MLCLKKLLTIWERLYQVKSINKYIAILFIFSCTEKGENNSKPNLNVDIENPSETLIKIKTETDWINEGYVKKIVKIEDNKCVCRKGIQYDTGERCRIHEYNNNECGSLTPYPKGDKRGIGSEFCKKPRTVKRVTSHGHHTWFSEITY